MDDDDDDDDDDDENDDPPGWKNIIITSKDDDDDDDDGSYRVKHFRKQTKEKTQGGKKKYHRALSARASRDSPWTSCKTRWTSLLNLSLALRA